MKALECYKDYMLFLPDAQGQLTPQQVMEFGRNSNSFKLLWFSSLPARMNKIQSKMKALDLEC